jgi:tRNA(Ile)-lysidine synthase TilS/MesJ
MGDLSGTMEVYFRKIKIMSLTQIGLPLAQPPWTGLGSRMESMCRKAIYEFKLLEGVSKISVALSGGKDSLALLFLLHAISGRGVPELEIHAIHVDGEFSCGAGVAGGFIKKICEALGVHLIVCQSQQKRETLACYSCSRERRRLIFEAAKSVGAPTIAFGHHRDDSIQTLLMNMLHKAEFAANLPKVHMHDYGVTIVRPLIYISENELKEFAKLYGFMRVVCQCPVGQNSMRRKAEELLSQIELLFPNARENLAQASFKYGSQGALER